MTTGGHCSTDAAKKAPSEEYRRKAAGGSGSAGRRLFELTAGGGFGSEVAAFIPTAPPKADSEAVGSSSRSDMGLHDLGNRRRPRESSRVLSVLLNGAIFPEENRYAVFLGRTDLAIQAARIDDLGGALKGLSCHGSAVTTRVTGSTTRARRVRAPGRAPRERFMPWISPGVLGDWIEHARQRLGWLPFENRASTVERVPCDR